MTTVNITLELPEELVRDAREFGLLTREALTTVLQAEVDRRVMDFVNAEIHAYRAEKRQNPQHQEPE
jgi:hypothetical protein